MRNRFSLTPLLGAYFCLSFLFLIPTQSKAVHPLIPPGLKLLDTIPMPALKDTVPEIQQKIEEARYRKHRRAATALAITSAITGILGGLLLAKGIATTFILTSSLFSIFGGVLLFAAGLTLVFGVIHWIRARRAKKRLQKAGVR